MCGRIHKRYCGRTYYPRNEKEIGGFDMAKNYNSSNQNKADKNSANRNAMDKNSANRNASDRNASDRNSYSKNASNAGSENSKY